MEVFSLVNIYVTGMKAKPLNPHRRGGNYISFTVYMPMSKFTYVYKRCYLDLSVLSLLLKSI